MPEFIKTAEVVGNIAKTTYNIGRFTTQFVAERLFTPGGWSEVAQDVQPANIQVYEGNIERGEE